MSLDAGIIDTEIYGVPPTVELMLIPLIFILPRLTDSLHPGNGGNPGFNVYDMNSQLRLVFYPAVTGFIFLGLWISDLRLKMLKLK